jgi:uncharacterized protein (TIGR03437 family)
LSGALSSVFMARIDAAVKSAVTVEDPRRLVPGLNAPVDYGIAGGEVLVLTGTGMGPDVEVGAQLTAGGKLATSLGGTSVTFDGVAAPLLSVQAQKIVCIVPFAGITKNPTTLQVQSSGSMSNSIALPATLTAIEPLATVNQDGTVNSVSHPAAPGSIVTIYAAGFGQTSPPSVDGQINDTTPRRFSLPIGVKISGQDSYLQDAQVLYLGPAPGQVAGITQINFKTPVLSPGTYTVYLGWGPPFDTRPFAFDYHSVSLVIGQP